VEPFPMTLTEFHSKPFSYKYN